MAESIKVRTPFGLVAILATCVPLGFVTPCHAQFVAHASIALTARLPSSATLTQTLYPFSIVISHGSQVQAEVPIELRWNIDPREASGVRVLASLVADGLANSADHHQRLAASDLEAAVAGADFRHFRPNTGMVLFDVIVTAANRQKTQQSSVQIRISDEGLASLPDGVYTGWVKFSAQII